MPMIRLYGIIDGIHQSITIDADGTPDYDCMMIQSTKFHRVASNMGEPGWFSMGPADGSLNIYDWVDSPYKVCGVVQFGRVSYANIIYAAIVRDIPLAFAAHYNNDNILITSHSSVQIWRPNRSKYAEHPMAIVDRTGQRLYINESDINDGIVRPIGEHVPFGWWLPHARRAMTDDYAAIGDIIACTTIYDENIPIWDARVGGGVGSLQQSRHKNVDFGRCVFVNEHLLVVCYDRYDDKNTLIIDTTMFDLRNADSYDIGSVTGEPLTCDVEKYDIESVFGEASLCNMHAFCAPTHSVTL